MKKVKQIIKIIEEDGWYIIKQGGTSHRQFKHPNKKGRVTIAGKLSEDVHPKTEQSIFKQAGIKY